MEMVQYILPMSQDKNKHTFVEGIDLRILSIEISLFEVTHPHPLALLSSLLYEVLVFQHICLKSQVRSARNPCYIATFYYIAGFLGILLIAG